MLSEVLGIIESLLKSGWVIVLGDNDAALPYGCDIKMYRVEDPVQRIKFIEGLAKYIEDDVMGKGLEEEITR
jgi:hypothetical protein